MTTLLITGATSGIGKALAEHAAQKGYDVIACGRNEEALSELARHENITSCQFDVSSLDDTKNALKDIQFDIAVLNAGTCEYVDIDQFESDMFRRVFEPNFFGVVNCVDAFIHNLKAGKTLVIVDSMARLLPFTRSQAYGASKAVSPGFVETPLTEKNDFDMPMKITAQEAAESMLKGIESDKRTIFFPKMFGYILRFMNVLPSGLQKRLSLSMRNDK